MLAGGAADAGIVSDCRQCSRSLVSASAQLGEQIDGAGVCLALAGSGGSEGALTVGGEIAGEVALQPVASSNSALSAGASLQQLGLGGAFDSVVSIAEFLFLSAVVFGLRERGGRCAFTLGR